MRVELFIFPLRKITGNKKLLGAPGIATRSKDATRGSWPDYLEQESICWRIPDSAQITGRSP